MDNAWNSLHWAFNKKRIWLNGMMSLKFRSKFGQQFRFHCSIRWNYFLVCKQNNFFPHIGKDDENVVVTDKVASLPPLVADGFCCPCRGFRSHDLSVFWMWTWWSRRLKVPRGLKPANRAVGSNISKCGLMMSTLKDTTKPQLIWARSRPTQCCDIINQLLRQTNIQKYP